MPSASFNNSRRMVTLSCSILILMSHVVTSQLPPVTVHERAITTSHEEHLVYEWEIINYGTIPKIDGCIQSPEFHADNQNVQWLMRICSSRREQYGNFHSSSFEIEARSRQSSNEIYKMQGEILISGLRIRHTIHLNEESVGEQGNKYTTSLNEIDSSLNSISRFDNITIRCEVDVSFRNTTVTDVTKPPVNEKPHDSQEGQLNKDFRQLLNDTRFSDVDIIVGDLTLPAHGAILAARSPVFAAMMDQAQDKETAKLEMTFDAIKPIVMTAILEYIYTDRVANLDQFPLTYELIAAADTFKLSNLTMTCGNLLKKDLNADNVADILVMSDRYALYELKKAAIEFIKRNFPDVMESEGYKKMKEKSPALLMEILFSSGNRF
ncbi:speckle-type POZ protein B-like [Diachasmimorpha longicaudata]|uniref:speckle-type POZ protein B-like n=1 Tax=Diachasmimorpha longicaudata TaxID=58733 RepID=UPI0030B8903B